MELPLVLLASFFNELTMFLAEIVSLMPTPQYREAPGEAHSSVLP